MMGEEPTRACGWRHRRRQQRRVVKMNMDDGWGQFSQRRDGPRARRQQLPIVPGHSLIVPDGAVEGLKFLGISAAGKRVGDRNLPPVGGRSPAQGGYDLFGSPNAAFRADEVGHNRTGGG